MAASGSPPRALTWSTATPRSTASSCHFDGPALRSGVLTSAAKRSDRDPAQDAQSGAPLEQEPCARPMRTPAHAATRKRLFRTGIFAGSCRKHRFDDLHFRDVDGGIHVQEDGGIAQQLLDPEIEHDAVAAVQLDGVL